VSRKERLKRYKTRLDVARKWRKDNYDLTWARLLDLYKGKHFADPSRGDQIAVNITFSTANVIVPSVAVNNPKISVLPRQEQFSDQGTIAEAVLNYWWRHYGYQNEIRKSVKDSVVCGHGWAKVGWRYRATQREATPEEAQALFLEKREEAGLFAEQNPVLAADLPTDDDLLEQVATVPEVLEDRPFVERVSIFDILVDHEATCLEDAKWIAQRLVVPLEVARKDDRYSKAARNRLKPDSSSARWRDEDRERAKDKYDDDVRRVTLWEFYDLQDEYFCVFPDECNDERDYLSYEDGLPYVYGHPFVMIGNYDVPDELYPIGDLEMLEPLQGELNKTRSMMMNHRKRYNRAWLAQADAFGPEARRVLEEDRDNRVVFIEEDVDLDSIIKPLESPQLNAEFYQYSEQIEADIELVSGVSEYQRGATSETRRTATEASIIQDAANARAADKLAQVERFIREVAERVLQLGQTHLTGEHVARVVGPGKAMMWVPFTRDTIEGEFDFEVEAGSTQPLNEMGRRQQALQLVQALSPYVGMVVNPQELVRYILQEGFGVSNPEKFLLQPLVDPATGLPLDPMAAAPPGGAPPELDPAAGLTTPTDGPTAIPPNVLTQLQGQVGLDLENST
jgi:hypothetical protein